jgi:hypothetical protein
MTSSAINRVGAGTPIDELSSLIRRDGYVIVEHMAPDLVADAKAELDDWIGASPFGPGNFAGEFAKNVEGLVGKSDAVHQLMIHDTVMALCDLILLPNCVRYQLNYTGIMHLEPGERAQVLHRDASLYPFQNPAPPTILATMWAVSDFTAENGATCLVPGSHLWDDERQPRAGEIVMAEMPAGSVLMYYGSTIHAGGANRSNGARTGAAIQFSLGWLRQEENQYLAMPMDEARKLPRRLQELMGYDLATVNLGFVDHKHPNDILNGTAGDAPGDLGPQWLMDKDNAILRLKVTERRATGRRRYAVEAGPTAAE